MLVCRYIGLLFIALCVLQTFAHAQTESVVHFEDEMENVILAARDSGIKSLTFRINAYQSENYRGERRKVRITIMNDSVVRRKVRLKKDYFVIRNGNLLEYDLKTHAPVQYTALYMKDSANCRVIWGDAGGMKDSARTSYCRFTYDSTGREVDYYFAYMQTCFHRTTTYEGDSVSLVNFWKREADTMRLVYNQYIFETYNADSSFYIRVVKERPFPNEIRAVDGDIWLEYRTYVTYDQKGKIVAIRQEEGARHSKSASHHDTINTLRVTYR